MNTTLSKEQKRVALERAMQKHQPVRKPIAPQQPQQGMMGMPPGGMGGDLASQLAMGQQPAMPSMPMMGSPSPMQLMPSLPPTIGPPPGQYEGFAHEEAPSFDQPQLSMEGEMPETELSAVEEQIQYALIADQLWKDIGGAQAVGGLVWADLMGEADLPSLDTPRDYFVSSYTKWKQDPVKFEKKYPKEARILEQLDDAFSASVEEGLL